MRSYTLHPAWIDNPGVVFMFAWYLLSRFRICRLQEIMLPSSWKFHQSYKVLLIVLFDNEGIKGAVELWQKLWHFSFAWGFLYWRYNILCLLDGAFLWQWCITCWLLLYMTRTTHSYLIYCILPFTHRLALLIWWDISKVVNMLKAERKQSKTMKIGREEVQFEGCGLGILAFLSIISQ